MRAGDFKGTVINACIRFSARELNSGFKSACIPGELQFNVATDAEGRCVRAECDVFQRNQLAIGGVVMQILGTR